ncbi:hypothetical protein P9H32_14725 [Pontiella sp. NLcol2]|uniref:Uncharacterized protein n=2 Tax=Pontiella agarivorans TaxID=3038953 RepID=A0ABU5N0K3_9BACT|nr:hypothetical protein [Pontiella agarivorans]
MTSSPAGAQVLPLQIVQDSTTYNLQSTNGVPLSHVVGSPPGSDGRAPEVPPATGKQYSSLLSLGGAVNDTAPADSTESATFVLKRVQIGAPFLNRPITYLFGSVVAVPETDQTGVLLSDTAEGLLYWDAEPYTENSHENEGYYWSPHSGEVYTVQPGPMNITWRKRVPFAQGAEPAYVNELGSKSFVTNGANVYLLYTQQYLVSGSPVKKPKNMYWTEKSFLSRGKPVQIPGGSVGAVNIVYNEVTFPQSVAEEYKAIGDTSPATNALPELRTLWYNQQQGYLYAYNVEGRVFVELLGDLRDDNVTREQLGFEIVDVYRQAQPVDEWTELGERIHPPFPDTVDEVTPEPLNQLNALNFAYRHVIEGSAQVEYYAARKTLNQSDLQIFWMEEGVASIRWPKRLARYELDWPTDIGSYSHYVRPDAPTDEEALATAVQLNPDNVPFIQYQDPFDRPRAKISPTSAFYTMLDSTVPAHRTLLRFSSGDNIAFQRVYSWLDDNLKGTNFADTIVEDLQAWQDYTNYPAVYAEYLEEYAEYLVNFGNYTNYISDVTRGVNGDWSLFVSDDVSGSEGGSISNWSLEVISYLENEDVYLTNTFSQATPILIPAPEATASPYPSVVAVSGLTGAVVQIKVHLQDISHAWLNDWDIFLASPSGRGCALLSDAGGGGAIISGLNLSFEDQAISVPVSTPASGTYRPTDYQAGESLPPGVPGPTVSRLDELLDPVYEMPAVPEAPANASSPWVNTPGSPRILFETVYVGQRIEAPVGEDDQAGYLNPEIGTSYHPEAYIDPFSAGFEAAALGAIIPVNAIPGANKLEAWWFRKNTGNAGYNAGDGAKGFSPIYWPSAIGRYTIEWPDQAPEIILASNEGGGALSSLQAKGSIYTQNDPELHGYNPNEEHAIMSGGTPFATRDDLNITTGPDYSSKPYVLLDYVEGDLRPAMLVFKVLREKPAEGFVFDYIVPAGQLLQAPMPLPLLPKPVEGTGETAVNYNTEPASVGDLPGNWATADNTNTYAHYIGFTYRDRKDDFWVYRGPHAGRPELAAGSFNEAGGTFDPLPDAVAVMNEPFRYVVHASRQDQYLDLSVENLPGWMSIEGLALVGTPSTNEAGYSDTLSLLIEDRYEGDMVTNQLSLSVSSNLSTMAQGALVLNSTNGYTGSVTTFSNRPPFLAASPSPTNSFTMRYYYKTMEGFAWPGVEHPPETGSIVPYLRPYNEGTGQYVGDGASADTAALEIVYRPVWPVTDPKDSAKPLPLLPYGATLAKPAYNLPGVRDWRTAKMLYQQSIASDLVSEQYSAILHDPTVFKLSDISGQGLDSLPGGVKTEYYLGKIYFPNLPPHLGQRLFFDPDRGANGSLVLKGEYKEETLGRDYLQLNLLRGGDLDAVLALCPDADPDKVAWDAVVMALSTVVETFHEDPLQPGSYIPDELLTYSAGYRDIVEIVDDNIPRDSYAVSAIGPGSGYVTMVESGGDAFTEPGDPVALHVFKVGGDELDPGELKVIAAENPLSELLTFQHTADLGGHSDEFEYEWKIGAPVDGFPPADPSGYLDLVSGDDITRYTLGGAGIQALGDNYVIMRYRARKPGHPLYNQWSEWTDPALAEGWIKRVLAGINPFNQRVTDLFNNRVNTDVSILTQAGPRWEGDIALNLETINDYGLIEIYETVLRRGRSLSIESGYNYGPANDALLLAAGYLSDLYMMLGNEAWADAANPTIGIGTADNTYGDIATALFSFKGQQASLLDEELALLRGRDDVFQPGVEVTPVYNRLIWNYTRGIDAGESIYALNYNIQENPNDDPDGVIDAEDAAYMYPQGHGDAYGHYLTALKGYYSLLMNSKFDWVPRIEAVNILGKPVSVDYQDERKFAAAAAAVSRSGQQVFDLTWRQDYAPVDKVGWSQFSDTRENEQRTYTAPGAETNAVTRHWGMDQWASRVGQGSYLNWVVGNAIVPYEDPDPSHEGIQKVDRTTVAELSELPVLADDLQISMDNAESGVSPLGVPEDSVVFDIDPNVVGASGETHFEQVYSRATVALKNALVAFDDAKDVTRLMRSEQDSLVNLQNRIAEQELAYRNALIELYGTPYTDDMGPGKTWNQEYDGPDLVHYMYVENPEQDFESLWNYPGNIAEAYTFSLGVQDLPADFQDNYGYDALNIFDGEDPTTEVIAYHIGSNGYLEKPSGWTGQRASPGQVQQVISKEIAARNQLYEALYGQDGTKAVLKRQLTVLEGEISKQKEIREYNESLLIADEVLEKAQIANAIFQSLQDNLEFATEEAEETSLELVPDSFIAGLAAGGDVGFAASGAIKTISASIKIGFRVAAVIRESVIQSLEGATSSARRWTEFNSIQPLERDIAMRDAVASITDILIDMQDQLWGINKSAREYEDAQQVTRAVIASGDRLLEEREIFRKRSAALVQGYRTRDAAFRIFRNEKLERYKTLFDLAARYSLLAANAYDYETGLLGSDEGRDFAARIIQSRALGVVSSDGTPQFAGSNTGDPGLSSALAEMKADWDVVKTRLGFNNPDSYGTTVSLRQELFRLKKDDEGDARWKEILHLARKRDLMEDGDIRRHCMQIANDDGLPVPGIVLEFSTTIQDGYNLFGKPLAAGDHAFSSSSFATKIHAAGLALEGYVGMDDPAANEGSGESPDDPDTSYLNPDGLSATPYVYLIPVGADSMRSPPLGDADEIRSWIVNDVALPMPFNIGSSDFSVTPMYQSGDTLSETMFSVRKHPAFRPVSDASLFSPDIYVGSGGLARSQYTSNRLIARSVWNTRWKIVIPGKTLLNDEEEGLSRLIRALEDIKIHFVTYSYSGN